jgi:hypothetical protein
VTVPAPELEISMPVYIDGPDWEKWTILHGARAAFDETAKWLSFMPDGNVANSPRLGALRRVRVEFDLFLPPTIQLDELPDGGATELFGLHSDLGWDSHSDRFSLVCRAAGATGWVLEASRELEDGSRWSSGNALAIPGLLGQGWNRIEWVVLLSDDSESKDLVFIQVNDRPLVWPDLDLRDEDVALRFFRLGNWDIGLDNAHLGIRNLEIYDIPAPAPPAPPPGDPPPQEPPGGDPLPEEPPGGDPPPEEPPGGDPPPEEPPGGDPPPELPPPPPPPPAGTVLYEQDFEGSDPFDGWRGRNVRTNLQVGEAAGNRYGKLLFQPHSDWRVSFLPRYEGVMDLRIEFSYRQPRGFHHKRYPPGDPKEGQIMGGGKHVFQVSNVNTYQDGREAINQDGWCRLDFGTTTEDGPWEVVAYRKNREGERFRELKRRFESGNWFQNGRWHRVRIDIHLNRGPGQGNGTCEMWVDGDHKGRFSAEINMVGPTAGIRCFGFGNLDNLEGEPWIEIDDFRIESL